VTKQCCAAAGQHIRGQAGYGITEVSLGLLRRSHAGKNSAFGEKNRMRVKRRMLKGFLWDRAKLTFCSTREDAAAALLPRIRAQDLYISLGGERDEQARPWGRV